MASKLAPVQIARRVTLGISLVGLTALTILHQRIPGMPSIDALDPFGGFETLLRFVAGGDFLKRIEPGTLVLAGGIVVLGLVLSRFFCGWLCGFGALQAVFGWIGKKLFRRRFEVPRKVDRILRWVKYPVLVGLIAWTWSAASLVIRPYDPLAAYGHLTAGWTELWAEFAVGLVLLVLTLVGSLFYERVFCKYLCPLGAVNAILSRVPLFRIKRSATTCISCSKCDKVCPMNVEVATAASVDSPECIVCLECVTACPTKTPSLVTTLGGKAVKLGAVAALGLGIYLGAAALGQAFGVLRFAPASLSSLAEKGSLSVADIKGSSTYEAVASGFGIELHRLYRELGITESQVPPTTMLKDTGKVAGIADFEADAVRVAVAKILGIPYAGEGGDAAAAAAVAAPASAPAAPPTTAPAASKAVAPAMALKVPADFVLEGTMSLKDVAAALGADPAAVAAKLGLPADIPVDKALRDLKDQYGFTMPTLKERIHQ